MSVQAESSKQRLTFQLGGKGSRCDQGCAEPLMTRTRCVLQHPEEVSLPRMWDELGQEARHALVGQKGWVGVLGVVTLIVPAVFTQPPGWQALS